MRLAALVAAIGVGLLALPGASGASPRASLPDIEDEVMCPICGTLLELSSSPQAERERAFIRREIAKGRSKQQIEDTLVAEYGNEVLAVPKRLRLRPLGLPRPGDRLRPRDRRARPGRVSLASPRRDGEPSLAAAPRGEDAERLDSDLARYDL